MNTVVVTGASSGIGREFVLRLAKEENPEEIWVIARREDRLIRLADEVSCKIRVIAIDLTDTDSYKKYTDLLDELKPNITVLVNASGYGKFGKYADVDASSEADMIDLNCRGLVLMTRATLPYMEAGGKIYQLCSVAAFQPVPYMGVYAATKAFVLSYSRALNAELRDRNIHCMAVCPYWTKTEFFDRAVDRDKTAVTKYAVMFTTEEIVTQAFRDMNKKKDISLHTFKLKLQILFTNLLPKRFVMRVWLKQQGHKY